MKNRAKSVLLLVLFTIINTALHADITSDQKEHNLYTIWLPGLHGGRADERSLLATTHYKIYDVIQPASQADLGQTACIRDFERQLYSDQDFQQGKKIIFIGSSQGAATLLNKIAQMTYAQQEAKIAALILEAPLADGNEAIMQSALKTPGLAYTPFVRFWSPWVGKTRHRSYNPYGMQALTSAKHISANIPVIILHNKTDARISVNSARKLVCEFLKARQSKKNNVYYIETDINAQYGDSHTDFLREDAHSSAAFHAICKHIGLPYEAQKADELINKEFCLFQPLVDELEKVIQKDTWLSSYARNTIDGLTFVTVAAALYVLMKKLYSSNNKPS